MSQPALAAPAPVYPLEDEVREALEICGGDPMKALRITLIANAFLEALVGRGIAGIRAPQATQPAEIQARSRLNTPVPKAANRASKSLLRNGAETIADAKVRKQRGAVLPGLP